MFQDWPIKRKVMSVMVLTSSTVLLLSTAAFVLYDLLTYHRLVAQGLSGTAALLAANSTTAIASRDFDQAGRILSSLRVNTNIVAAALYDRNGYLFARYPAAASVASFPLRPAKAPHRFEAESLLFFAPVAQNGQVLGTLYLKSSLQPHFFRLRLYGGIALLVLVGSTLVAIGLSNLLQSRITRPVLALAETAKVISERRDYSVRARHQGSDELGLLTAAFNQMLARIEVQAVALREGEARLAGMINSAMDAIISVDARKRITLFNGAAEMMFRYPAAKAIGQPLERFIPERFREKVRAQIEAFGRSGLTARTLQGPEFLSGLRADGEEFPLDASISQVEIAGQRIYTVILRDVTERKQAEDKVRRLNAELEQRVEVRTAELTAANREMEAFTYSVAHDLRAPLRHMDAFSRALIEDFGPALPPEARQYLESISRGSRKMSQLVDDLLNLARVGRQTVQTQLTSLSNLVDEVVAELKSEASGRIIEWRLGPLPAIPCDAVLMKQVFANLLSNSVKYTRPRSVAVVEIGLERQNGNVAVFVRDNGVGFDMRHANKLFGVFQRLHRSDEFEGTGVGLATVERIVRKHGGAVWGEGALGKGAAFFFTLPGLAEGAESLAHPEIEAPVADEA